MKEKARMRGVFERPPGSDVWWINYHDADGVRHREKIGRESVAVEAYLQRRMEVREGKFVAPRSVSQFTFRELAEERMATRRPHLKPRSYDTDARRLKLLVQHLGILPARSITSSKIEEALSKIGERRCSGSTLNRYRTLLGNIFSVGIRNGRVQINPVQKVQRRREPAERVRFLAPHEEKKLRRVIRRNAPVHEPEMDLAMHTGIRRGEQWGLRWSDVDLANRTITVYGKTGRGFVPVNATAQKAIKKLHRISNGSPFVSVNRKREEQGDNQRWFNECVKEAGIPDFRWHDLRHTFASRLLMQGANIAAVQKLLRHQSIETTMRYAHLSREHLHDAVEKLDRWHQDGTGRKRQPRKVLQMQLNQSPGL